MATGISARLSTDPRAAGRKFGLQVGAALLVFAGIALWRDKETVASVLAAIGGGLVIGGLAIPRQLAPVEQAWMQMALMIAKVTQPIFLGIVYFFTFLPIGLLMRAFGKNPMRRRPTDAPSFWEDRAPGARKGDLLRRF